MSASDQDPATREPPHVQDSSEADARPDSPQPKWFEKLEQCPDWMRNRRSGLRAYYGYSVPDSRLFDIRKKLKADHLPWFGFFALHNVLNKRCRWKLYHTHLSIWQKSGDLVPYTTYALYSDEDIRETELFPDEEEDVLRILKKWLLIDPDLPPSWIAGVDVGDRGNPSHYLPEHLRPRSGGRI